MTMLCDVTYPNLRKPSREGPSLFEVLSINGLSPHLHIIDITWIIMVRYVPRGRWGVVSGTAVAIAGWAVLSQMPARAAYFSHSSRIWTEDRKCGKHHRNSIGVQASPTITPSESQASTCPHHHPSPCDFVHSSRRTWSWRPCFRSWSDGKTGAGVIAQETWGSPRGDRTAPQNTAQSRQPRPQRHLQVCRDLDGAEVPVLSELRTSSRSQAPSSWASHFLDRAVSTLGPKHCDSCSINHFDVSEPTSHSRRIIAIARLRCWPKRAKGQDIGSSPVTLEWGVWSTGSWAGGEIWETAFKGVVDDKCVSDTSDVLLLLLLLLITA